MVGSALGRLGRIGRETDATLVGAAASAFVLALVACGVKFGLAGLALPLVGLAGLALLRFPGAALALGVGLAILAEDESFPLLTPAAKLYTNIFKGFTPLDALLVIAFLGVALRRLETSRPVRLPPRPLAIAQLLTAFALLTGVIVGHEHGAGTSHVVLATHVFNYLIVIPLLVVNLDVRARDVERLLAAGLVLAAVKAVLGFMALAKGGSAAIEGTQSLTYYAPTANWLMTVALLAVVAALVLRVRVPWWVVAAAPLVLLCLVLSYRRSFWIADAVGLLLVVVLGVSSSSVGRRLIVPVVAALGIGIYLLGNVALQSDTPIAQRVQTLSPDQVAATPDDRYRLDERANVAGELRDSPVAGLGLEVPWHATTRSLPVEVNPDHLYVHFAALFWWLKLGILGLLAYVGLLLAGLWLSARAWLGATRPALRAFGLASLCAFLGLVVIETTATFTGSDQRFTLLLAAQLGLLAAIDQLPRRARGDQAEAESSALTSVV
jgi:O-antigen ligase